MFLVGVALVAGEESIPNCRFRSESDGRVTTGTPRSDVGAELPCARTSMRL